MQLVFVHVDLDDEEQAKGVIEFFGLTGDKPAVGSLFSCALDEIDKMLAVSAISQSLLASYASMWRCALPQIVLWLNLLQKVSIRRITLEISFILKIFGAWCR